MLAVIFQNAPPITQTNDLLLLSHKAVQQPSAGEESTINPDWTHSYEVPQSDISSLVGFGEPRAIVSAAEPARLRKTTEREELIGDLRSWRLLDADWDGEGANKPIETSLKQAESFARLYGDEGILPEPMLHASGRAGLYWRTDDLYADLEFLGDGHIAYYVERHGDKHKGQVYFDSKKMPAVFPAILDS